MKIDKEDLIMSNIHRTFGPGLSMQDLGSLEYVGSQPLALIKWKRGFTTHYSDEQKAPIKTLADNSKIPFYCIRRNDDATWFSIEILNDCDKIVSKFIEEKERKDLFYVENGKLICNLFTLKSIICKLHGKDPATTDPQDIIFGKGDFEGQSYRQVYEGHVVRINKVDPEVIDVNQILSTWK